MLDLTNRGRQNADNNERKAWKWMLVDSAIIGAIAMAASMPSTVPEIADLWVMFKAFLGAFILQIAVERGLKKKKEGEQ